MFGRKAQMYPAESTLKGRDEALFDLPARHRVLDAPLVTDEVPEGFEVAYFGLGCFWGAEEMFWQVPGVWSTSVGYQGGTTPNPTYEEVCSGLTNHTEAVRVVFDPSVVSYADLVKRFFEVHDPTQGMRQGNDVGTQYRSGIYYTDDEQKAVAEQAKKVFGAKLAELGYGAITTEVVPLGEFYYAEGSLQQYLANHPNGYRCHSTTGLDFPRDQLACPRVVHVARLVFPALRDAFR